MSSAIAPFAKIPLPDLPIFDEGASSSMLQIEFVKAGEFGKFQGCMSYSQDYDKVRFASSGQSEGLLERFFLPINGGTSSNVPVRPNGFCYDLVAQIFKDYFPQIASQAREKKLSIPYFELVQTLNALLKKGYVTEEEKKAYLHSVPTKLLRRDFEEMVVETHDVSRSIVFACKSIRENNWMAAIVWLTKAKQFYQEGQRACGKSDASLNDLVDLSAFWGNISKISGEGVEVFKPGMEELLDIAAASSTIKEIDLKCLPVFIRATQGGLGRFLAQSKVVERVSIAVPVAESNAREDFSLVIEGLKRNSSVRVFRVFDYSIGDAGVAGIVDAIQKNEDSKMQLLELSIPDMTGVSAIQLLELMRIRPSLKVILVDCLKVSLELRSAVEMMASSR